MNTYYETLGLQPGASQAEIKKAYFKLVRQHSPEKDPEMFQKIREAYEQLQKGGGEEEGPQFPPFRDPMAETMMKQIAEYQRAGDNGMVRDACEEALRFFPEEARFLYLLVQAQRKCGNTGKAVKSAERLVEKDPGNKWFLRELALSYLARGFVKKAHVAFGDAFEAGCRDNDFLLSYSIECDESFEYEQGMKVLFEIVRKDRKWSREDMPDLLEAYAGLFQCNHRLGASFFLEIMEGFCQWIEQYRVYLADSVPEIAIILSGHTMASCKSQAECQAVWRAFEHTRAACRTDEDRALVEEFKQEFEYIRLSCDKRICATLKFTHDAYCGQGFMGERVRKFALTDVQLCMLEERQEILAQEEILRQDYPDFYEKLEGFLRQLRDEKKITYLKDSLLKTYRRMAVDFSQGYYYERYPQERERAEGILIDDGGSGIPYVREGKKTGRNDPCPCGSGKKYKHCCMGK